MVPIAGKDDQFFPELSGQFCSPLPALHLRFDTTLDGIHYVVQFVANALQNGREFVPHGWVTAVHRLHSADAQPASCLSADCVAAGQ